MYPSGQNTRSSLLEWSVAALGAAAAVYLASQVHLNLLDKERLQAGQEEVRRKVASVAGAVKQGEEAFQKREIFLQKLEAQEARHAAFLKGLLDLSKTDPDARSLVFRHKVGDGDALPEVAPPRTPPASPASQRAPESAPSKPKSAGTGR
jgi:hypothetical protein